jgi:carbonic anhydrase
MIMKRVDITYRYEARDTPARPRPLDSNAALGRLNNGNRAFAALLDDPTNKHVEPAREICTGR